MNSKDNFMSVWFARHQSAVKCSMCASRTTRLVKVGQLEICCECGVKVMGAINDVLTRHADEARKELAKKGGQDASATSRTDA